MWWGIRAVLIVFIVSLARRSLFVCRPKLEVSWKEQARPVFLRTCSLGIFVTLSKFFNISEPCVKIIHFPKIIVRIRLTNIQDSGYNKPGLQKAFHDVLQPTHETYHLALAYLIALTLYNLTSPPAMADFLFPK